MTPSFDLQALITSFALRLRQSGTDSPRLSAEVLLAHALGLERNDLLKRLILEPETGLSNEEHRRVEAFVARRANGEPVAYIVGVKEFYGRDFDVSPATLVPRPETELLVELALEEATRLALDHGGRFADFGTGTGCIAVTLALDLPRWRGLALDINNGALRVARANARLHEANNLLFARADFTAPPLAPDSLDILISNPPYVSEKEYAALDREVREFEPKPALVPALSPANPASPEPASGLEHISAIICQANRLLKPDGLLLMEIGNSQGSAVFDALSRSGWGEGIIHKDLAGLDRVLIARK